MKTFTQFLESKKFESYTSGGPRYRITVGDSDKKWEEERLPSAKKWANELSKYRRTTAIVTLISTGKEVYRKDYEKEEIKLDPDFPFVKQSKDGSPKTCKFCHKPVWWHSGQGRWYNPGGTELHVQTCELAANFYKNRALDSAELNRHS